MQEKKHHGPPLAASARSDYAAAAQRLDAGDPAGARRLLDPLVKAQPRFAEAIHLLAVAHYRLGGVQDAEVQGRRAIGLDPRQAMFHVTLGDVLAAGPRRVDAEKPYRSALALDPAFRPALRQLAQYLNDEGRPAEALILLDPLLARGGPADLGLLSAYAAALKAVGRTEDACATYRRAVAAAPRSGVAEHNLAALLGDLGRNDEAAAAAERALAKGLNAPETHMVRGRALLGLGRLDAAQGCFTQAAGLRPTDIDVQRELAQLIWMRTGDAGLATSAIDCALKLRPDARLVQLKAGVLSAAGRPGDADALLGAALRVHPQDAGLHLSASGAAIAAGDPERGLALSRRAQALAPAQDPQAARFLCEALLAVGEATEAAAIAQHLVDRRPDDQVALACLATAWRLLGDPRYEALFDYGALVKTFELDAPAGWSSRAGFISDVAEALTARHAFKTHPLEQSLRHGSQAPNIFSHKDPVLAAFQEALDAPIRDYIGALGPGADPLRRRNTGRYRFQGAWSVRLRPGGGRHASHVHGEGWISSACYLALPDAVGRDGSQACIRFGEPGIATRPTLEPELLVVPRPGMLVLFPSYMWHGTVPFQGDQPRLTAAFDLVPMP